MRLSPTYCRIQLFVFSFVCLHMIIPSLCNLYEAPAPHAVTPQGRDSFVLFVRRGHLFVVISLSFFFNYYFCFSVRDVPCEMAAFEYSSQGGSEIDILHVIGYSQESPNLI